MEQGQLNTRNVRLGDVLKEFGYITDEQLKDTIETIKHCIF